MALLRDLKQIYAKRMPKVAPWSKNICASKIGAPESRSGENAIFVPKEIHMRQKLTLITLGVADIARAEAFYTGLGWQKSPHGTDDLILFDLGGLLFSLYPRHELAADATLPEEGHGFAGIALAHNTRSREETDAVLAEAVRLGGTLVKPAQDVFWGGYSGYFKDLDGHLFEVAYNPFWPLDDSGAVALEG
jgi:uncharacterized protein